MRPAGAAANRRRLAGTRKDDLEPAGETASAISVFDLPSRKTARLIAGSGFDNGNDSPPHRNARS
jgi:hypothetical protein